VTVVGPADGTHEFRFGWLPFECALSIPYWGSIVELIEVIALGQRGAIKAHIERFSLDRVEDAYPRLRDGTLEAVPSSSPEGKRHSIAIPRPDWPVCPPCVRSSPRGA
jgi:alcohol dehydrogenase, propanol-preferring